VRRGFVRVKGDRRGDLCPERMPAPLIFGRLGDDQQCQAELLGEGHWQVAKDKGVDVGAGGGELAGHIVRGELAGLDQDFEQLART